MIVIKAVFRVRDVVAGVVEMGRAIDLGRLAETLDKQNIFCIHREVNSWFKTPI
jgi:hypothetical protein